MHYSKMPRTVAHRPTSDRHLERYPMSNSDLINSSSDSSDEDISDLVFRKFRSNGSTAAQPPPRLMDIADEQLPLPIPRRPHSMQPHCVKCNKIRTNPKFRHSSVLSSTIRTQSNAFASDGHYENDYSDSTDDELEQKMRFFSNARRRTQMRSYQRYF